MKKLQELYPLWDQLADVPVDEKNTISEPFLHFEKGVPAKEIWHWFETNNRNFVAGDLMNGKRLDTSYIYSYAKSAYIDAVIADLTKRDKLVDTYTQSHEGPIDRSWLRSCAEQDFEDDDDACCFPDLRHICFREGETAAASNGFFEKSPIRERQAG